MSTRASTPQQPNIPCDAMFPYPTDNTSSTAIIVATTRSSIDRAMDLSNRGMVTGIIGADSAYSIAPSEALHKLERKPGRHIIVVFSDQLTSSVDAPVLTSRQGQQRFLSLVEAILNNLHGFRLIACTHEGPISLPPGSPLVSVLRVLSDHLDANRRIGSNWLAEAAQVQRLPGIRLSESRIRQRIFHSAMMHMYWEHPDFNPMKFDQIHGELKSFYRASEPRKEPGDAQQPGL